jgi:hypothetical protein
MIEPVEEHDATREENNEDCDNNYDVATTSYEETLHPSPTKVTTPIKKVKTPTKVTTPINRKQIDKDKQIEELRTATRELQRELKQYKAASIVIVSSLQNDASQVLREEKQQLVSDAKKIVEKNQSKFVNDTKKNSSTETIKKTSLKPTCTKKVKKQKTSSIEKK